MKHNKAFQDLQNNDGLQFIKTTVYGPPKNKLPDLNIEKFMKPKLSKEQKLNKQKLEALLHPGALMMLVDFIKQWYGYHTKEDEEQTIIKGVIVSAARLKVQYMNNITPVVESKQMGIVDEINRTNELDIQR